MLYSLRASDEDLADAVWGKAVDVNPTENARSSVSSNMFLSRSTDISFVSLISSFCEQSVDVL